MTSIGGALTSLYNAGAGIASSVFTYVTGQETFKPGPVSNIDLSFENETVHIDEELETWRRLLQNSQAEWDKYFKRYDEDLKTMTGFSKMSFPEKQKCVETLQLHGISVNKLSEHGQIIRGLCALRLVDSLYDLRDQIDKYAHLDILKVAHGRIKNIDQRIKTAEREVFRWVSAHSMSEGIEPAFSLLLDIKEARASIASFLRNGPLRIVLKSVAEGPFVVCNYENQEILLHSSFKSSPTQMMEAMLFGLLQLSLKQEAEEVATTFKKGLTDIMEAANKRAEQTAGMLTFDLVEDTREDTSVLKDRTNGIKSIMKKAAEQFHEIESGLGKKFLWDPLNKADWESICFQTHAIWDREVDKRLPKQSRLVDSILLS